jgi:monofunctional glycosyltransferase
MKAGRRVAAEPDENGGTAKKRRARKAARIEPTLEAAGGDASGGRTAARLRMWMLLRRRTLVGRLALIVTAIALLPLVLTLIYAIPFVRPVSTLMLADLVMLQGYTREWRPIEEISPNLKASVIMSEDGQFCSHHGIDLRELKGVVEDALEGESPRGASTLTMQVAKNLFLWNGRSFVRKALELPLAVMIDLILPKRRIMEIYLNIAEWGPDNVYGIGAGARRHFNVDAASMSRRQAALLTVTLPNPHLRNPAKPSRGMSAVARVVERRARSGSGFAACVLEPA